MESHPEHSERRTAFEYLDPMAEKSYHNKGQLTFIIAGLCLSTFYFGYNLTYLSTIPTNTLNDTFGTDSTKPVVYGILIGCIPIGAAIGALLAPLFMKCLTRKNFLIFMNFVALAIGVVIQYPNLYVLLVCRILQGILIGNFMALVPIYINELCPKEVVGSFGVFTQLFVVIAVVLCYIMGMIFVLASSVGEFMWRFMFAFTQLTVLIQLILFFTGLIPQSPVSLLEAGKESEAKKVLLMFNSEKVIEEVMKEKWKEVGNKAPNSSEEKIETTPISLFLGFQLPFMQQLSGTNAIVTQVGKIVSVYAPDLALYAPVIINIVQVIATAFAVFGLSKWGRRPLILIGNFSLGLIDLLVGVLFVFSDWSPAIDIIMILITLFMISYGITIGPVVWLYVPEIIPARIVPVATFMNWFGCSICVIITPILIDVVGSPYPVFFIFGGVSMVFFVFNWLWLVETKGLTVSEINGKFKK